MSMVTWLEAVETAMLANFDRVITVSRNMVRHLEDKGAVSLEGRCAVLPIFPDPSFFQPVAKLEWKARLGFAGRTVFVYSGGMQQYQCIEQTLRWFAQIGGLLPNSSLLILTPEVDAALRKVEAEIGAHAANVVVLSAPRSELPNYISAADFGFVLREREVLNQVAAPTKAVEYLARGVRLICTADAGSSADYIASYKCGIIVPLNPAPAEVLQATMELQRLQQSEMSLDVIWSAISKSGYGELTREIYA